MLWGKLSRWAVAWSVVGVGALVEWSGVRADETTSELPLKKQIRVVDEAGQGIAGATVVPWAVRSKLGHGKWMAKGQFDSEPPTLTTDAEGKATIPFPRFVDKDEKVPPQELTCRVEHPDYAATTYNDVPVTDGALADTSTIAMQAGAKISVVALIGDQVLPVDRVYAQWSSRSYSGGNKTKVTADGALDLPRLPAGSELLQLVYVPDDGPTMYSDVQTLALVDGARHNLRLQMKPSVRVEGRLDGPVARPVKNGRVIGEVIFADDNAAGETLDWRVAATMRIDGSFVFESMPRGNLQVIALCDGAMAASGEPPEFATDGERQQGSSFFSRPQVFAIGEETNRIVLAMAPTADCLIHVLGPDGQPVEGAKCAFWPNVGWWRYGSQIYCQYFHSTLDGLKDPAREKMLWNEKDPLFQATTDAEGKALVKNLPAKAKSEFVVMHETLQAPGGGDDAVRRYQKVELTAGAQSEVTVRLVPKKK